MTSTTFRREVGYPGYETVRFQMGDIVLERVGCERCAPIKTVKITGIRGRDCVTSTGNWYDRLTGRGVVNDGTYRGIHSQQYEGQGGQTGKP